MLANYFSPLPRKGGGPGDEGLSQNEEADEVNMTDARFITNGTILTMDPSQPEVEAVGVIGERIVAVGNRRLVTDALPRGYATLDLAGRTLLPGFNEAHNHMIGYGINVAQLDAGYPA